MVTVLLMNYKRRENLNKIILALKSQTIPCEIFVWNNAPEPFVHADVDWVLNSSDNVRCWPRWLMGTFAKNDYIMSHDDDLLITQHDALECLIKEYKQFGKEGMALGPFGVILGKDNLYFPKTLLDKGLQKLGASGIPQHLSHPLKSTKVDLIKGRMVFFKKSDLHKIPLFPMGPNDLAAGDDIVISAHLANGALGHHLVTNRLNGKIQDIEDKGSSTGLWKSHPNWKEMRNETAQYHFKEKH
jgi:hypothetical protein|tara:strand:- start:2736 stop:3464 length:729 start_codon:yes stop_codon:yes gene_type:complete